MFPALPVARCGGAVSGLPPISRQYCYLYKDIAFWTRIGYAVEEWLSPKQSRCCHAPSSAPPPGMPFHGGGFCRDHLLHQKSLMVSGVNAIERRQAQEDMTPLRSVPRTTAISRPPTGSACGEFLRNRTARIAAVMDVGCMGMQGRPLPRQTGQPCAELQQVSSEASITSQYYGMLS